MSAYVQLEVADGVGTIRIDRPPANAIDEQLGRELGDVARQAGDRVDIGAVVVWGGPKIFAAGADIKDMAGRDPAGILPVVSALGDALLDLESLDAVTIAAVNGFALGGGCEVALACDLRVASDDAQFGQPEIMIGVIPGAGGTQRLPEAVGRSAAAELILTGRRVGADEARRLGLVHRVVPAEEVRSEAERWARSFAQGPRLALTAAKRAMRTANGSRVKALEEERAAFVDLFDTADQAEGMRAFLEKRAPRFGGR